MDENVTQEETLGTANSQTADTGTATEQTNAFQEFLAGIFKGKEASGKESKPEESVQSTVTSGLTKEEVTASIEEAKKQWFAELEETERKKGLSPEDAEKEEKATTQKEVEALRQQILEGELRTKAVTALDKLGYPVGLADLLKYENEDNMNNSLTVVQEVFKASLEAAIKQRLKGKTPEGLGGSGNAQNDLRDQIAKGLKG